MREAVSRNGQDRRLRVIQIAGAGEGADWFPPICAGLRDRGHEVVAVIDTRHGDLGARLETRSIPVVRCDLSLRRPLAARSHLRPLGYPADAAHLAGCAGRLRQVLRTLRADVVITHLLNATVIGRVAATAARVPVRMTMVPSPLTIEAPLTRWLDRLTLGLDDAVIAGSEQIRELYLDMGIPAGRLERVYYGADAERFDRTKSAPERIRAELGVPPGTKLVAQVAHFYAPWRGPVAPRRLRGRGLKGHDTMLCAAQLVRARRPDTKFLLAGGARGPEAQRYRERVGELARALRLADSVSFLGDRNDVPDILAAADVAVQCSLAENLGGTIEALLMATPTVATRVGGMPEAVVDEQTGLLVPPDDPPALAAAILKLLDDPARAAALADAGRARMLSGFTLERTIADLDRIIRDRT